jgi:hypothetical protein
MFLLDSCNNNNNPRTYTLLKKQVSNRLKPYMKYSVYDNYVNSVFVTGWVKLNCWKWPSELSRRTCTRFIPLIKFHLLQFKWSDPVTEVGFRCIASHPLNTVLHYRPPAIVLSIPDLMIPYPNRHLHAHYNYLAWPVVTVLMYILNVLFCRYFRDQLNEVT